MRLLAKYPGSGARPCAPLNRPETTVWRAGTRAATTDSKTKESAFSLIEVVIAVAVFAMAATVLTSAFSNALLSRERSVSNDLQHADIRAVRMQLLLEADLEAAEDGGEVETLNSGEASWEAEIEPTEVIDLFQVRLSIRFREPKEDMIEEHVETLYLLRPTWSDSGERSDLLQDKRQELEDSRRDLDF